MARGADVGEAGLAAGAGLVAARFGDARVLVVAEDEEVAPPSPRRRPAARGPPGPCRRRPAPRTISPTGDSSIGSARSPSVVGPVAVATRCSRVRMKPGHSTETFTGEPVIASSNASASESPTTACFVAVYGLMNGQRLQPGDRRGVDDVALLLLDEPGDERADAVQHAPEVHAERPVPARLRDLPHQPAAAADARVVAHDVRGAEVACRSWSRGRSPGPRPTRR